MLVSEAQQRASVIAEELRQAQFAEQQAQRMHQDSEGKVQHAEQQA